MSGVKVTNKASTLSRALQITALLAFAFGLWRLWTYFTRPLAHPEYMLYTAIAATVIGVGVLCFDEVAKLGNHFVGWAFLFGVGVMTYHIAILFVIFPAIDLTHPIYLLPTRAAGFCVLSAIIITEAALVKRSVVPSSYRLDSDTIMPIILKMTAVFAIAWGTFLVLWQINNLIAVDPIRAISPLILGATSLVVGSILVIWVERQKRQPSFRMRKLPLIFGFILLLSAPVTGGFYLWAMKMFMMESFILPLQITIGLALIIESFYIFYTPMKSRSPK